MQSLQLDIAQLVVSDLSEGYRYVEADAECMLQLQYSQQSQLHHAIHALYIVTHNAVCPIVVIKQR